MKSEYCRTQAITTGRKFVSFKKLNRFAAAKESHREAPLFTKRKGALPIDRLWLGSAESDNISYVSQRGDLRISTITT
ncbi:MAG: hypothetical protein DWQ34_13105 [Planctomycetota bacterium]|nr:MAG: hypothetical protein DWQ34_13105 [Planctomycetota bacterium]REJ96924.1 MAG: hypothetical protein DWQ29_00510 [Planctomycetota bacterium]REK26902.1 MAG: hypothetical protein DWQ41_08655 [Planctomycetota bacterium]REK35390.1 MAG: hypothetical protein DWQ45_11775 [Planctomycetota bacterium]